MLNTRSNCSRNHVNWFQSEQPAWVGPADTLVIIMENCIREVFNRKLGHGTGYLGQDAGCLGQDAGFLGQDTGYLGQDTGYHGRCSAVSANENGG